MLPKWLLDELQYDSRPVTRTRNLHRQARIPCRQYLQSLSQMKGTDNAKAAKTDIDKIKNLLKYDVKTTDAIRKLAKKF